ncbi:hypothetical protein A9Q81_11245 [Gammaproteobacteria bacterium 42_54_T18]|nr:hypothetical protein A9Q81_11245 [Gammaproteobacteria bacterium 42_54_T18]
MSTDTRNQSQPTSASTGVNQVTRALPPIVKQVRDNSLSILVNQLTEFFVSCDDLFFELAGKAGTNKEQNDFFDTMREIRLRKKQCISQFKQQFELSFSSLSSVKKAPAYSNNETSTQSSFEGLGLVGNDEMEKNVALSSTISKARSDCQESLYHLVLRLDFLMADIDISESNNPLDPAQICEAFSKATDVIDLTLQNRIIFFKQFDRIVARKLNKIINLANELLINAGILPQIKPNTRTQQQPAQQNKRNPVAPSHIAEPPQNQNEMGQTPNQLLESQISAAAAHVTPGFSELSQLLTNFQATGNSIPGLLPRFQFNGPAIEQDQLIQSLTYAQAQQPYDVESGRNYIRDIVQTILQPSNSDKEGKSLEEPDENVINLVAMFFDFVLDDQNLPVTVQALIGRLQIPILKVALKDKTFFEDAKHPARLLINKLAESSVGLNSEDKEKQDILFSLIQLIVQEIHDKYDGSLNIFKEQLALLESQLATEQRRARVIERRTSEAALGQAKTEKARSVVRETISERIKDAPLPSSVSEFLVKHWHKFLLSNHLRHGIQSPEWLDAVQVIDDLIWVIQPHTDSKSQQRATRLVPHLTDRIQKGIKKANAQNEEWNTLLPTLLKDLELSCKGRSQEVHQEKLNKTQKEALGITKTEADKSWQQMTALDRQQAKQNALQFESLQKAEGLPIGSWVTLKEPNRKSIRCKLSAKLTETDSYVFVNRFGIKSLERDKKDVAMSIQKGYLCILESGLLFERAMDRITSTLRKPEAAPS